MIFAEGSADPTIGADGIKFVTSILESYGWKLEDSIHYCGTSESKPASAEFEELALRAFKDGEHLVV
jgi:hypothetical protein